MSRNHKYAPNHKFLFDCFDRKMMREHPEALHSALCKLRLDKLKLNRELDKIFSPFIMPIANLLLKFTK